jgi:hypothetical protein
MAAVTALLEEIRGETAPAERYDLRAARGAAADDQGDPAPDEGTSS